MRARLGTMAVFCVIAAMFLLELARGVVGNDAGLLALGALPDDGQIHHEYWRLITFGFLHWNLTHVLLNTALLLWVGPVVERRAGSTRLLFIFLSASVASGVGILFKHLLWPSQGVSVGASGGLFGLLGAALVLVFRSPAQSPVARIGLIIVLVLGLTYSVFPGISMTGHIIGLIIGAALALRGSRHSPAPPPSTRLNVSTAV
jgi:membrane associated rhomboid family serine protease